MAWIWLLVLLVIILLIVFLLWKHQTTNTGTFNYVPKVGPVPPPATCTDKTSYLDLPLTFDRQLGLYMTEITLNGKPFRVVPDSGSTNLLVTGSACQNCHPPDGVFDMTTGTDISGGVVRTVSYGGGQKTTFIPWRASLQYSGGSGGESHDVDFGVIVSTYSPDGTPQNVLGLESRGFLSTLCGEKTVIFDFPRGRLYIGNVDQTMAGRSTSGPIQMYPSPNNVPFVLGKIKSMTVNGVPIPSSLLPTYGLIDTGTTSTITNPTLAPLLKAGTVDIVFVGSNGQDVTVSFKNRPGIVEVGHLQVPNSIIIGNQWLNQYAVALQYDTNSIEFFT